MIAAFLSGLVSALGFEPLALWPATLLGVAALVLLLHRARSLRSAFGLGWWFGVGHFALGLNWIAKAFTFQAAMPVVMGWVAVVGLSMFLAIYVGMATAATHRLATSLPARVPLLAATWMAAEWLRGTLFTGFAWNPLGAPWLQAGLAEGAAFYGALGLSGVMVLAGGAVAVLLHDRRAAAWLVAVVALLLALPLIRPAPPPATRVQLHLVQPDIEQSEKYDPDAAAEHLRRYLALTEAAQARRGPGIVAWPEAAIEDLVEEDQALRRVIALSLQPGSTLLFGGVAAERDRAGEVIGARNSLFVMGPDSRLTARYDKAHLVPGGEYLPLRAIAEPLGLSRLVPGSIDFWPGPGPRTLRPTGVPPVGIQICYEIIFGAGVVDRADRPAWILNVSNDAWFDAWGPPQHFAQARLRAIEEGLPVARATPTGITGLIDAKGAMVATLPPKVAAVLTVRLPAALPPTPFARFGHVASLILGLALAGAALVADKRSKT